MRKFDVFIQNTFLTGGLSLGATASSGYRGFSTPKAYDESVIKSLSITDGSTLVVLGNLFHPKVDRDRAESLLKDITQRGRKVICLEGGQDSRMIRELSKSRLLEDGGDMSILYTATRSVVVSFYPMMSWPKKDQGYLNAFGCPGAGTAGSIECSVGFLMSKLCKPVVSLQYLSESYAGKGLPWR